MFCLIVGLSDPFCVVRVNNSKKFKTNVIYESLAPVWNESVSIAMPEGNDKLIIVSHITSYSIVLHNITWQIIASNHITLHRILWHHITSQSITSVTSHRRVLYCTASRVTSLHVTSKWCITKHHMESHRFTDSGLHSLLYLSYLCVLGHVW